MRRVEYLRANLPLTDAMEAAFCMRHSDYAVNWRHNYIVSLTTLRATGHVLHKVDAKHYPEISNLVDQKFLRWKRGKGDDALFKFFIEEERNQLLKTYQFTSSDGLAFYNDELDSGKIDVINEGFFEGCDVTSITIQSVEWWQVELAEIAEAISNESIERIQGNET